MKKLNEKDKKAYAFIRNHIIHSGKSPTLADINAITERSSLRSAVLTLERLEDAGLIRRDGRTIRLVSASLGDNQSISTVNIPLVGAVAAGTPILAFFCVSQVTQ